MKGWAGRLEFQQGLCAQSVALQLATMSYGSWYLIKSFKEHVEAASASGDLG
jgi:hypothetical protein